jgi:hypothetical protein
MSKQRDNGCPFSLDKWQYQWPRAKTWDSPLESYILWGA